MLKLLVTLGGIGTAAFGIWHFFVPKLWDWYSYIPPQATELVLAIRAINVFFALCLLLIGIANILLVYFSPDRVALGVILAISSIFWAVRCLMQIIFPQGSANHLLQYGMLSVFVIIFLCFLTSLILVVFKDPLI
jgi:hypothetical protein